MIHRNLHWGFFQNKKHSRKKSEINSGDWEYYCDRLGFDKHGVFVCTKIEHGNIYTNMEDKHGAVLFDSNRFELIDAIKVGDVYKNGDGKEVRIICIDRKDAEYKVLGLLCDRGDEFIETYTEDGKYRSAFPPSNHDLILPWNQPKTDWTNVAVDTLIEVPIGGVLVKRYFACSNGGVHLQYFAGGRTSKTANHNNETVSALAQDCKIVKE